MEFLRTADHRLASFHLTDNQPVVNSNAYSVLEKAVTADGEPSRLEALGVFGHPKVIERIFP
jgi:hypothetical protein